MSYHRVITAGDTNVTIYFHLFSTVTGEAQTGVVYNDAGASVKIWRERVNAAAITLSDLAGDDDVAHGAGKFGELTNQTYTYRLDLADSYFTTAGHVNVVVRFDNLFDMEYSSDILPNLAALIGTPSDLGSGATIADNLVDIGGQTDDIGAAGAGLTAVPWNASWDTEVQSEVQDALEVNHLDHLLAVDYDPASKPGIATALLNELIENDGGVSRYTANALEQAPSGGGGLTSQDVRDAMKLSPTAGAPAASSVDEYLGDILLDTGTTLPASLTTIAGYIDTEVTQIINDIAALNDISPAQVNAEVVDALNVDTYPEPGQVTPSATLSLAGKIGYLFKAWRNPHTQTETLYRLFNDDGTTVDQKANVADDGATFSRGEVESGP